jgi:Ca2+-binding EF-hand superfamily protein
MTMNISSIASSLFTKLDTKKQGYFEIDDLKSAFDKIQDTQSDADDVFSQLDVDGDGKVTQSELTSSMESIADSIDNQFNDLRMSMAMAGMGMMPPPPANDSGFTKEELQSQIEDIGNGDSKRESLLSKIVANFDDADADGDGKVSFNEAIAYDQSSSTDSATEANSSADQNTLLAKVMQMLQAYNPFGDSGNSSGISTSA